MTKIIDIHSHMFNLKYLPVAGILRRYSRNIISHRIATGLEWMLLLGIDKQFQAEQDKKIASGKLEEFNTPLSEFLDADPFDYSIEDIIKFKPKDTIKAMLTMVRVSDLLVGPLKDAIDEYEMVNSDEPLEDQFRNMNNFSNLSSDDKRLFIGLRIRVLKRMLNWVVKKFKEIRDYLKWFAFMRNSEEEIYRYINKIDAPGVEYYLHLMMDVDHYFNKKGKLRYKSRFNFETEQIPKMQALTSDHKKLIAFVAFSPARDKSLETVKDAIENKGFKGVKFYPPLGYKAYSDKNPKYRSRIKQLFQYCSDQKIPVFTHCNNKGFEAHPKIKSGYNANPKFWEMALMEHPNLILCLGHAGGSEGWFSENLDSDYTNASDIQAKDISDKSSIQEKNWNKSYAALVYKLCVTYDNVYCDTSYLDDMIKSNGHFNSRLKENYRIRLLKLFQEGEGFNKKIMYGSDWHMLFQEGKNKVYLKLYKEFFLDERNGLLAYSEDYFYKNALNYLKLNEA